VAFVAVARQRKLAATRDNEHGSALARPEQNTASPRTARSGLRLFTEGFDTRGLKEAKALAGGVSLVSARALGDFRVWHISDLARGPTCVCDALDCVAKHSLRLSMARDSVD
jgi:hypothetical protein